MNSQMSYLLGMVLGNGEINTVGKETTVTIDIPHKKLIDDCGRDIKVYVGASLLNIEQILKPLIGADMVYTSGTKSTKVSFTKNSEDYIIREIKRLTNNGSMHTYMCMNNDIFEFSRDEKIELLRGIADVTGYIRDSNRAFGKPGAHRVYLEIPLNWELVIDIALLLKELDIPIQNIDFGHPNFRDSDLKKYNSGNIHYWKKEHQIKIYANEFLPVGFNIKHKQDSLERYAEDLEKHIDKSETHKHYWEKTSNKRVKLKHPGENDPSLPEIIRGKHYDHWTHLARDLGYHE